MPHLLIAGTTGSGKTSTLYSCLSKINTEEKNIVTIEDPVEFNLEGINQIPVNPKIGMDFKEFAIEAVKQKGFFKILNNLLSIII